MRTLEPSELQERLQAANAPLLLDVREPWEFDICRIDGSMNLPMGGVPAALDSLDPERETVVICHHGMRSAQVVNFLAARGFQVTNLTGGIEAWAAEVEPDMPRY